MTSVAATGVSGVATEAASDALTHVLRWVRLAPDPVAVWLVCADGPARLPARRDVLAVRLPGCVHAIPVSGYLELALAGATTVRLIAGTCCTVGAEPAELGDARTLLTGHRPTVLTADPVGRRRVRLHRAQPVPSAATLPLPRRALFAPIALTRLPYRPHSERERLLGALDELGEAAPLPVPAVAAAAAAVAADESRLSSEPPSGALLSATGCTACAVCVKGCPSGALALTGGPTVLTLTQDAARCTDCPECVRLCPEDALSRVRSLTWEDLRDRAVRPLATVAAVTCARCGQAVAVTHAEHGLCPVCAYRREQPFGSTLPPHLAHR